MSNRYETIVGVSDKITEGKGELDDFRKLESLSSTIKVGALCGLGKTAANPVLSTLHKFKDEYIAHIVDKKCPAHVCKSLIDYHIDPARCKNVRCVPVFVRPMPSAVLSVKKVIKSILKMYQMRHMSCNLQIRRNL